MAFDQPDKLVKVLEHLTPHRLEKYMASCNDDLVAAIRLYVWNSAISGALHFPIQALEVALRNALHRELSEMYCPEWYSHIPFLDIDAETDEPLLRMFVDKAKEKLGNRKKPVDPPHMVAALEFGFWTYLIGKHFEPKLWAPGLHRAFPLYTKVTGARLKVGTVSGRFDYIRAFRNRIAHYEPIFQRDLAKDYENILAICSWMFDDLRAWVECHCTVAKVLVARP